MLPANTDTNTNILCICIFYVYSVLTLKIFMPTEREISLQWTQVRLPQHLVHTRRGTAPQLLTGELLFTQLSLCTSQLLKSTPQQTLCVSSLSLCLLVTSKTSPPIPRPVDSPPLQCSLWCVCFTSGVDDYIVKHSRWIIAALCGASATISIRNEVSFDSI